MPKQVIILLTAFIYLLFGIPSIAQTPFICQGQVYCVLENGNTLATLKLDPSNGSVFFKTIRSNIGIDIGAMGYRSSDNFLYGLDVNSFHLYRIDANGMSQDLGILNLPTGLTYKTATISNDGRYFYTTGSNNNIDQVMVIVDLDSPTFSSQTVSLNGSPTNIVALAIDPYTNNKLFAFDATSRSILQVPTSGGIPTPMTPIDAGNEIQELFFDPFGQLLGYGSALGGGLNGYFQVDKNNGSTSVITAGALVNVLASAACPYTVAIKGKAKPSVSLPCQEITFTYTIANASAVPQAGIELNHLLPLGFQFTNIIKNPYGGNINPNPPTDRVAFQNLTLSKKVDSIVVILEVDDILAGSYGSQAQLDQLPASLGNQSLSDDPRTISPGDSTRIRINRFNSDSLHFNYFICSGESVFLDVSIYGNNILWNDGSTATTYTLNSPGNYSLESFTACQSLKVSYEVTQASCPYTIDIAHDIIPRSTLPCSEVVYEYVLGNDSGFPRPGLNFFQQLPPGFTFVEILENQLNGQVSPLPASALTIENLTLPEGKFSLKIRVAIGDVPRGVYQNQAFLDGLPEGMGESRESFDLQKTDMDSTAITVLDEVAENSVYLEYSLCGAETFDLDGSAYGSTYLWDDGSTESILTVSQPGEYELTILDGCINSYIYFTVSEGDIIEVSFPAEEIIIRRGDEYQLDPKIRNSSPDSLITLQWIDPFAFSLTCRDCRSPIAYPVQSGNYQLIVDNESCRDTARVRIVVEDKRKLFIPNVISPNGDGANDYFYIQSPDYGLVLTLRIYNRWGALVFASSNSPIDQATEGWDGMVNGKTASAGSYVWYAEIKFEDGETGTYWGDFGVVY